VTASGRGTGGDRRRPWLERLIAENQRPSHASARLNPDLPTHIAWLTAELQRVGGNRAAAIRQSPVGREQEDLRQRMPGMGWGVA
jgi:hypothetical protein